MKKIKYYLEQSACMYGNMQKQALTLINELESENEKLAKAGKRVTEINEELSNEHKKIEEQLKDRIAELENQMCRNEDLHTATEKLNNMIILKQFAERLFEKYSYDKLTYKPDEDIEIHLTASELDETLKEFIKE